MRHKPVPYLTAELVCKYYYPEIVGDTKKLISLCYCALMYDNPGVGFIEILRFAKRYPNLNGLEIYKIFIKDTKFKYKEEKYSIDKIAIIFIEKLIKDINNLIGYKSSYYNDVLENIKNDFILNKCRLLEILYDEDMSDKSIFEDKFADFYGYPFIEGKNLIISPKNVYEETDQAYIETSIMLEFEILYKRLTSTIENTLCPYYRICKLNAYTDNDIRSPECSVNQWDKKDTCLMSEMFRFFKIKDKRYIQE